MCNYPTTQFQAIRLERRIHIFNVPIITLYPQLRLLNLHFLALTLANLAKIFLFSPKPLLNLGTPSMLCCDSDHSFMMEQKRFRGCSEQPKVGNIN